MRKGLREGNGTHLRQIQLRGQTVQCSKGWRPKMAMICLCLKIRYASMSVFVCSFNFSPECRLYFPNWICELHLSHNSISDCASNLRDTVCASVTESTLGLCSVLWAVRTVTNLRSILWNILLLFRLDLVLGLFNASISRCQTSDTVQSSNLTSNSCSLLVSEQFNSINH